RPTAWSGSTRRRRFGSSPNSAARGGSRGGSGGRAARRCCPAGRSRAATPAITAARASRPPRTPRSTLWAGATGTPGDGPGEFQWPWGVAADRRGNVYVADRGNARVQKFARDGTWLAAMGAGVLTDPTELAVGPRGTVAVVDGAAGSGGGSVQLF